MKFEFKRIFLSVGVILVIFIAWIGVATIFATFLMNHSLFF